MNGTIIINGKKVKVYIEISDYDVVITVPKNTDLRNCTHAITFNELKQ